MREYYIFRKDSKRWVNSFDVLDSATPEQVELAFQQSVGWSCMGDPAEDYFFVATGRGRDIING